MFTLLLFNASSGCGERWKRSATGGGKKNNLSDRIMRQEEKKERNECREVRKRHVEISRGGEMPSGSLFPHAAGVRQQLESLCVALVIKTAGISFP